jgi:hypothetical protein
MHILNRNILWQIQIRRSKIPDALIPVSQGQLQSGGAFVFGTVIAAISTLLFII